MKTSILMIPLFVLGAKGFNNSSKTIYFKAISYKTQLPVGSIINIKQQDDPLMAPMNKNMKDMEAQPMKGNTDHDFASMMKLHHQGAIQMAQIEIQQGKDDMMKQMAQKMKDAQTKEVAELNEVITATQNSAKSYDPSNKQVRQKP